MILLSILGFLSGLSGSISTITSKITDLKIAQVHAESNLEKAKIDAQVQEAEQRRDVLVAEAGTRINGFVRFGLTLGPAAFLLKVFLWDKVIGSLVGCAGSGGVNSYCYSFRTDPLSPELAAVVTAVIAFYFVYDITARVFKK